MQCHHSAKTKRHMRASCSHCRDLVDNTHYQRTDLGHSFIADFCYWLIHEKL